MAKKVRRQRTRREFFNKKCKLCKDHVETIDYKDVDKLKRFVTRKGRILPRRMSGNCVKHQHRVAASIKRARYMALLPYVEDQNI